MYLVTFRSDYHDYYAIGDDIDKAVKKLMERYGKQCYGKRPSVRQLAKMGYCISVYEFSGSISFDDEYGGLPGQLFDYLEFVRNGVTKGYEMLTLYKKHGNGKRLCRYFIKGKENK